jgi:hypothetical protein
VKDVWRAYNRSKIIERTRNGIREGQVVHQVTQEAIFCGVLFNLFAIRFVHRLLGDCVVGEKIEGEEKGYEKAHATTFVGEARNIRKKTDFSASLQLLIERNA